MKFTLKKRSLIWLLAVQKYTRTESFAGCFYIQAVSYIQFISSYILFTLHLRVDYIQVRDEGIVLVAVKSPVTLFPPPVCGAAAAIFSLRGHFEEQMQFLDLKWSVSLTCAPAAAFCRDLGPRWLCCVTPPCRCYFCRRAEPLRSPGGPSAGGPRYHPPASVCACARSPMGASCSQVLSPPSSCCWSAPGCRGGCGRRTWRGSSQELLAQPPFCFWGLGPSWGRKSSIFRGLDDFQRHSWRSESACKCEVCATWTEVS